MTDTQIKQVNELVAKHDWNGLAVLLYQANDIELSSYALWACFNKSKESVEG